MPTAFHAHESLVSGVNAATSVGIRADLPRSEIRESRRSDHKINDRQNDNRTYKPAHPRPLAFASAPTHLGRMHLRPSSGLQSLFVSLQPLVR
jgi:hypothetical protein